MNRVKAIAAVTAVALVGLVGCGPSNTQTDQAGSTDSAAVAAAPPSQPSPDELATQERPADQVALEGLYKAVNDAETSTGNAINDKANFMKAYRAYCTVMQNNGVFKNWTAVVHGIYPADPNNVTVKGPSISLRTPGGLEVFHELDERSPIYKIVLGLKEGDYVKFSISITHVEKEEPGIIYDECHDPDYESPKGPLVNTMLIGDLTSLVPIS